MPRATPKACVRWFVPHQQTDLVRKIAEHCNQSESQVITEILLRYGRAIATRKGLADQAALNPRIEYLLRPKTGPDWIEGGGRWLLDWLILREPSYQDHHVVVCPRHWPIPHDKRETRCYNNGGDSSTINDEIAECVSWDNLELRFPRDFGRLLLDDWLAVCRRYRGCCGERLRQPGEGHWDEVCDIQVASSPRRSAAPSPRTADTA